MGSGGSQESDKTTPDPGSLLEEGMEKRQQRQQELGYRSFWGVVDGSNEYVSACEKNGLALGNKTEAHAVIRDMEPMSEERFPA